MTTESVSRLRFSTGDLPDFAGGASQERHWSNSWQPATASQRCVAVSLAWRKYRRQISQGIGAQSSIGLCKAQTLARPLRRPPEHRRTRRKGPLAPGIQSSSYESTGRRHRASSERLGFKPRPASCRRSVAIDGRLSPLPCTPDSTQLLVSVSTRLPAKYLLSRFLVSAKQPGVCPTPIIIAGPPPNPNPCLTQGTDRDQDKPSSLIRLAPAPFGALWRIAIKSRLKRAIRKFWCYCTGLRPLGRGRKANERPSLSIGEPSVRT